MPAEARVQTARRQKTQASWRRRNPGYASPGGLTDARRRRIRARAIAATPAFEPTALVRISHQTSLCK